MTDPSKLLAYFASDLALRNSARYLSRAHAEGYSLLALDSRAMAMATRAGVPYTLLDDWLDPQAIVNAVKVARDCAHQWFEPAREEFTVDGICLPQVDRYNMDWFWQDAILALELASKLRVSGIREFKFFGNLFPRAGVLHGASDTSSRIWRAKLGAAGRMSLILEPFNPAGIISTVRKAFERVRNRRASLDEPRTSGETEFPENSVVIVLRYEEDLRFSHLVKELCSRFPGRVAAVIGSHASEKPVNVFDTWNVPVSFSERWPLTSWVAALPSWLLPAVDSDLQGKFLAGYKKSVKASIGQPWHEPLEILGFHFEYYCRYRWPFLYNRNFQFWLDLFKRTKPRAVLVTGEAESIFVLVSEAAVQRGVPVFVIPHACGVSRLMLKGLFKGTMLYNSALQRRHFERSEVDPSTLQGCARLAAKDEYPVRPVKAFDGKDKCRLLALTESTCEGPHLNTYTSPSAQLRALRALVNPPPDLQGKIEVRIKVHPHISDIEMLEAAGPAVLQELMPRDSELESALNETDVVVAVNYRGGAMVHALKMAKPIVYFLAEKEEMLQRPDFPYDTYQDGTVIARTPEEFWNLVRTFIADPAFGEEMRTKSADFSSRNLTDDGYPGLADFVLNQPVSDRNA